MCLWGNFIGIGWIWPIESKMYLEVKTIGNTKGKDWKPLAVASYELQFLTYLGCFLGGFIQTSCWWDKRKKTAGTSDNKHEKNKISSRSQANTTKQHVMAIERQTHSHLSLYVCSSGEQESQNVH